MNHGSPEVATGLGRDSRHLFLSSNGSAILVTSNMEIPAYYSTYTWYTIQNMHTLSSPHTPARKKKKNSSWIYTHQHFQFQFGTHTQTSTFSVSIWLTRWCQHVWVWYCRLSARTGCQRRHTPPPSYPQCRCGRPRQTHSPPGCLGDRPGMLQLVTK